MLLFALLACGSPELPTTPAPPVWVESRRVDAGAPVLLHAPAAATMPTVEGLTFTRRSVGDDGSAVWEVTGGVGSYILDIPDTEGEGGAVVPGAKLFVDIGVDGPTGGPMEDLALTDPPAPAVWPYVVGIALLAALVTAGAVWAWRRFRPVPPPPPPDPADVAARKAWAAVRRRTELDPERMAFELSMVYKRYLELAHGWPATARTTREILDNLSGELTAAELDASRRLLTAMDLVKFAERETHAGLFESLDRDFDHLCRPVRGMRS